MKVTSWYLRKFGWIPRPVRQVIVLVIGGTLLLLAVAGMVLPIMPGVIFVVPALAILAAEFAWAALWLKKVKSGATAVNHRVRRGLGMKTAASSAAATSDSTTSKN